MAETVRGAFSLDLVPTLLDSAKARARAGRRSDEASFLHRLIGLEDWLELRHPRSRYRDGLRAVRRLLEDRLGS